MSRRSGYRFADKDMRQYINPEHVPAKACPGLDPGWLPVRRQGHAPMPDGLGPWIRRRSDVIRLFSIEVALFLAPFVAYALFLWAAREGVLHPAEWAVPVLVGLSLVAVVLTAGGFAF